MSVAQFAHKVRDGARLRHHLLQRDVLVYFYSYYPAAQRHGYGGKHHHHYHDYKQPPEEYALHYFPSSTSNL